MEEVINWMGGWPKEGLLSALEWEEMRREQAARAADAGAGTGEGGLLPALGERLAAGWLGARSAAAGPEAVLQAAPGADAALQAAFRGLLQPGDIVLTERPTSRMALQAIRRVGALPVSLAGDQEGMDPDALAQAIDTLKPKLVYASPSCTDPEGRIWSERRFGLLAELCASGGVTLLLDERQAALAEQADQRRAESSAKTVRGEEREPEKGERAHAATGNRGTLERADRSPETRGAILTVRELPPGLIGGLRFGWLTGTGLEPEQAQSLARAAAAAGETERVSAADQLALLAYAQAQPVEPALATLRFVYRTRNALLAETLRRQGRPEALAAEPQAGVHAWLTLPDGLDAEALLRASWLKGVLFQPGNAFYASEPDRFKIRLTAVHSDEREIREGVRRIEEAIGEFMGRSV
ncbi:aminotransferase class I/II-fold pyridoxal phosphate-dependent enzyme [Cohnella nanjingensis]|uniref:PLP-dependent aminotransferase family protein n=1 Tax=Cohnella nanjingensis TaxID=1387779 RepID=A0A7X0RNK4_9BACL|nr:PLP-dependent aminotransferase family protein [Cohnella nanjingensis]MBB6669646.1 PLP-dependent aminotransferase family protein [Cohnella nanjingensis]